MTKKPLPPTCFLAALVAQAVLHLLLPGCRVIPFPWSLLGAVPLAMGLAVEVIADRAFKRHSTTVKPFEKSSALVTDGVFAISRHPMYLGFVLVLLGVAVLMGSWTPYVVVVVFAVLTDVLFIRVEERMLEKTFGEAWREYKKEVRRWA